MYESVSAISGAGKKGTGISPLYKNNWKPNTKYVKWSDRSLRNWKDYFPDWSEDKINAFIQETDNFENSHISGHLGFPRCSLGFK